MKHIYLKRCKIKQPHEGFEKCPCNGIILEVILDRFRDAWIRITGISSQCGIKSGNKMKNLKLIIQIIAVLIVFYLLVNALLI